MKIIALIMFVSLMIALLASHKLIKLDNKYLPRDHKDRMIPRIILGISSVTMLITAMVGIIKA